MAVYLLHPAPSPLGRCLPEQNESDQGGHTESDETVQGPAH